MKVEIETGDFVRHATGGPKTICWPTELIPYGLEGFHDEA